jgi:FkbM family methyltransferase
MIQVNGVWIPETERHMIPFLTDPNEVVDGRGTYQRKKWTAALATVEERKGQFRVAIDVGAHVGLWACHLAKRFATVHCFEPHPLHVACLERNAREYGVEDRLDIHAVALGDKRAMATLSSNIESSGDTWIDPTPQARRGREDVEVPVMVLDAYGLNDVDLIKMDCEGFELAVLRGAMDTIHRCHPVIVVEQKHTFAERYGYQRTEACTVLQTLGARLVREISGDYIYAF